MAVPEDALVDFLQEHCLVQYHHDLQQNGVDCLADFSVVGSREEVEIVCPSVKGNAVHMLKMWHAITTINGHPAGIASANHQRPRSEEHTV